MVDILEPFGVVVSISGGFRDRSAVDAGCSVRLPLRSSWYSKLETDAETLGRFCIEEMRLDPS